MIQRGSISSDGKIHGGRASIASDAAEFVGTRLQVKTVAHFRHGTVVQKEHDFFDVSDRQRN